MTKKEIFFLCLAAVISVLLCFGSSGERKTGYQKEIAGEIIRFHVIGASDRESDQRLKLKVKDAVVGELQQRLAGAENIEEARKIISSNIEEIETLSNQMIEENGFSYTASASLGQAVFPIKRYGNLAFPAGEYEALRIELGQAEGKNWWCVMFPTLCFVDETRKEITSKNKEEFRQVLTEEEYESLEQPGDRTFYKFKIGEYLNQVIDYFSVSEYNEP